MRAGKLRTRILIEEVTGQEPNALGQPVDVWETFANRWASVQPADTAGREFVQAAAVLADVTHRVEIRYLAGVTPKHRVKIGARILEILSVADPDERHRMLVLWCKEQV